MRTIKFRAKIKSSRDADHKVGDWIYYSTKDVFENNFGHKLIRIENECQYTSLKDKSGKEIWEGDIVKKEDKNYVVKYYLSEGCFNIVDIDLEGWQLNGKGWKMVEVIGNIYKNKELLK